jgi:hypothetical protein
MTHRSPLALIPLDLLFADLDLTLVSQESSTSAPSDASLFDLALTHPQLLPSSQLQRRPGPENPQWKIPPSEWPNVVRRVEENQEPLRQIARDYGVSYEAVRRVLKAARKHQAVLSPHEE